MGCDYVIMEDNNTEIAEGNIKPNETVLVNINNITGNDDVLEEISSQSVVLNLSDFNSSVLCPIVTG